MKPSHFRPSAIRVLKPIVVLLAFCQAGWAESPKPADGEGKPTFRTEKVKRDTLKATVNATGTVEPEEVIDVGAQVSGVILQLGPNVDFCTTVKKGQVLAEIDPRVYKIQLAKAEAALKAAEAALDQTRSDKGPTAVKAAEAGVELAKLNLEEAKANLDYCTITAPVDGVVIDRRVKVGQTVVSDLNAPSLFLLAKDLSKVQVWATVNEADIGEIHVGQEATFTVDARPGKTYRGTVEQIRLNATMTKDVVAYTVVVSADNPTQEAKSEDAKGKAASAAFDRELLPYLTANLAFHVAERKNALLVPNAALRWRPPLAQVAPDVREEYERSLRRRAAEESGAVAPDRARGIVWQEDGGLVRPVRVAVGLTDGTRTEVVKVLEGDKLDEGAPVVVGDDDAKPPPKPKDDK